MSNRERFMVAAVLIGLAGMFLAGRWSVRQPAVVAEKATTHEQAKEKTHEHQMVSASAATQTTQVRGDRATTRRFRPDGTLASETVRDSSAKSSTATQAQAVEVRWLTKDREVIKTLEVTKLVESNKLGWAAFGSAGMEWTGQRTVGVGAIGRVWGPLVAGFEVEQVGSFDKLNLAGNFKLGVLF